MESGEQLEYALYGSGFLVETIRQLLRNLLPKFHFSGGKSVHAK